MSGICYTSLIKTKEVSPMSILTFLVPFLIFMTITILLLFFMAKQDVYDERQQAARGLAHRDGFLSLVIFILLYIVAVVWLDPSKQLSINLAMTALFAGMDVYLVSCILRGGYLPINKNPKKAAAGWAIISVMYLAMLFLNPQDFFQKGIESRMWVQLLCCIEFTLVTVLMLTRMALDKKTEET